MTTRAVTRTAVLCALILGVIVWLSLSSPVPEGHSRLELDLSGLTDTPESLTYTVRGEVRFLHFWLGRDKVGGGQISLSGGSDGASGDSWEQIDLRFGSNPERVPGNVNLFGYARERSYCGRNAAGQPELIRTVFEGFIRPRDQSGPSAAGSHGLNEAGQATRYKAFFGAVTRTEATAVLGYFASTNDPDYRAAEELIQRLHDRMRLEQSETRSTIPREPSDGAPYGFLSAAKSVIGQITDAAAAHPRTWLTLRPTVPYVYQAKPFRLLVLRTRLTDGWLARSPENPGARFDVVEVDARIENVRESVTYDFSMLFPVRGLLRGLPLRIVHKPRWWLRLQADAEFD